MSYLTWSHWHYAGGHIPGHSKSRVWPIWKRYSLNKQLPLFPLQTATKDYYHHSVKWLWRNADSLISLVPLQTKKKKKQTKAIRLRNGAFGALRTAFTHNQRRRFWVDRPGGRRITLSMCFEQMVELFWPLSWKWIGLIWTATTLTLIKKLISRHSNQQSSQEPNVILK